MIYLTTPHFHISWISLSHTQILAFLTFTIHFTYSVSTISHFHFHITHSNLNTMSIGHTKLYTTDTTNSHTNRNWQDTQNWHNWQDWWNLNNLNVDIPILTTMIIDQPIPPQISVWTEKIGTQNRLRLEYVVELIKNFTTIPVSVARWYGSFSTTYG